MVLFTKKENSKLVLSAVNVFFESSQSKDLLRAVLELLEMKCMASEMPQLTHGWLFAKEEVGA